MAYKQDTIEPELKVKEYNPSVKEIEVRDYVKRRIEEMKEFRKSLKVEDRWKEADAEYEPNEIELTPGKKRLESDDELGLRSRLVPVGGDQGQEWRSNNSDPTLLTKIQTAFSIIIDRNPEAVLTALLKKYEKTSDIANSIWKRNWEISNSKQMLKLFVFNLAKYGIAYGRTYPKLIKYNKKILTEVDTENPENNKYENKELVWYNDVGKQNLNPWRTWLDEMTMPYDKYSTNECYHEQDYTYDQAKVEFGNYPNFESIGKSAKVEYDEEGNKSKEKTEGDKRRTDIITIGCFESRLKDLYIIYVPAKSIMLYHSPLPNDDGLLSIWHTMWILRSASRPDGISLWEIIRQDKHLYDKMMNMTMDQLVLSIYKMFFYSGTAQNIGDGEIKIQPGKGQQIINGKVDWLEVPGPGKDAWEGLQYLKSKIDDNSGITPTLEGEVTGKTLGEVLHAKEASLKRIKTPLENIAWAIEQDVYLTLSWTSQIYSIPEVREFADEQEILAFEEENGVVRNSLSPVNNEEGIQTGFQATYLPQLALHLEDREGQLFESNESKFFQIGVDIKPEQLRWKGIIKVIPKSVMGQSVEVERQMKDEMFNKLVPLFSGPPELFKKAAMQLLKVNEEDPDDWLPDLWLQEPNQLFIQNPAMQQIGPDGQPIQQGQTMQGASGMTPMQGAPTVVPQQQQSMPNLAPQPAQNNLKNMIPQQ